MTDTTIDWAKLKWTVSNTELEQAQVRTFVDGNQYVLLVVDLADFDNPPESKDQCQPLDNIIPPR